jgi:hypothetical protein
VEPLKAQSTGGQVECGVCMCTNATKVSLGCGHVLCEPCVIRIKEDSNKCPFCKQSILLTIRLFI